MTPIVFRMMAKDRKHRYRDAAEVVRDLQLLRPNAGADDRQMELALRINQEFPTQRWRVKAGVVIKTRDIK